MPLAAPAPAPDGIAAAQQGGDIAKTAGAFAAVVAAAVAVGTLGAKLDEALNPNSNEFSQIVAGVTFAAAAGAIVGAATGLLSTLLVAVGASAALAWPIAGAILAVAAVVYALTLVAQDLARLQYGQAGARNDYAKQYFDLYQQLRDSALATDPALTEGILEQKIRPFIKGYLARLNWAQHQRWLQSKIRGGPVVVSGDVRDVAGWIAPGGVFMPGSFPDGIPILKEGGAFPGTNVVPSEAQLWDFTWPLDRGYLIGESPSMRPIGPTPPWDTLHGPEYVAVARARLEIAEARAQDVAERAALIAKGAPPELITHAISSGIGSSFGGLNAKLPVINRTISAPNPEWAAYQSVVNPAGGVGHFEYQARINSTVGFSVFQKQQAFDLSIKDPVATDAQTAAYYLTGWVFADFSMYKEAAKSVKGNVTALRQLAITKAFEGDIGDDGALTYLGVRRHYSELE